MVAGDGDPRHGTLNGYSNLLCKCEACKHANRIYRRAYMVRYRRARGMLPRKHGWTHGTRSTYNKGCDCEPCKKAEREYRRLWRSRLVAA